MVDSLQQYHPWLRDRVAAAIQGDDKPYSARGKIARALVGSNGATGASIGLLDYTPAGIPLNAFDAGRHLANGQYTNAMLSGIAALPGAAIGRVPGLLKKGAQTLTDAAAGGKIAAMAEEAPKKFELPEDGFVYPGGKFMTRNEAALAIEKAHPTLRGELASEFDDMSADTVSHLAGGHSYDEDIPHGGLTIGSPEAKLVVARKYHDGSVVSGKPGDIHADLPMEPVLKTNSSTNALARPAIDSMSRRGFMGGLGAAGVAAAVPGVAGKVIEAAAPKMAPEITTPIAAHIAAIKSHMEAVDLHNGAIHMMMDGSPESRAEAAQEALRASMRASEASAHDLIASPVNGYGDPDIGMKLHDHEEHAADAEGHAANAADANYDGEDEVYEAEDAHNEAASSHTTAADAHVRELIKLGVSKETLLKLIDTDNLGSAEDFQNLIDGAYHN